ncbi:MAG: redoxin domain-containing protein [Planctomycetales bacterium]|nr:redoxin domain-containing protein [Planctomycetales bacterium]
MRDNIGEIEAAGAQLLVVDPHEEYSAKFFLKDIGLAAGDVGYPLLLDPANTVSADYGVAMQMRVHTELSNRPATFIIDTAGQIRFVQRATTFADRPTIDRIVEVLRESTIER